MFVAAIAAAGVAFALISFFRARADESRQAVAVQSTLEAQLNLERALQSQVIATQRVSPNVKAEFALVRSTILRTIADIERFDDDAASRSFRGLYATYDDALQQKLRLIEAGEPKQAERLDDNRMHESLSALQRLVHDERLKHNEVANRHETQAQLGTAGILLVASILIVLLFRKRERGQDVLRQLTQRHESILNAASEGIFGIGADGRIEFVNAAGCRMTGFDLGELIGKRKHELIHHSKADGSSYSAEDSPVSVSLADGSVQHADDEVYWRKNGTSFPVEYTSTPIVDGDEVTGAVVVFKDITDRRATEAALTASERQTRQILETAHDAFLSMDEHGLILDCNVQAEAIFGWSREEMLGRALSLIIPERAPEDHDRALALFLASGEGPEIGKRAEVEARHRDGRRFPLEMSISAFKTDAGYSCNAFVRDISERRAVEALLERRRRQLVEAQAVGAFGSWEWDVAADATEWSAELFRIYGLVPTDETKTFEDYLACVHPDDRAFVKGEVQAAFVTGEPFSFEHRIVRPDGVVRVCEGHGEVIMGDDGVPLRMLGTDQDITERREAERAKDEFTSVVSHELRTPLTSIRGSLGLLESGLLGALPPQGQRMVEIAVQNTDRLVRLINDILDIERINSGEIDMRPEPCDARELIERATEAVAQTAAHARVTVFTNVEPVRLFADSDRVIQTLTNLISNAVKFSPAGSNVRVSCARRGEEVLFEVSDEGRGIPEENLETIFGRFAQVDASDSREKGGTGLGLAICRSIVEQHGGRIWAQSVLAEGATFSFVLPAPIASDASTAATVSPDGPRVLVCDDDPCVVEFVSAVLEQRGYRVSAVHSGDQALEHALAEPPDAILLDLLMPGMSGWETAAALGRHATTRDVPIVILSLLARTDTAAPDGTVVDWLQKPLDDVALFAALERAVIGRDEPLTVLVVEDDEDLAGVLVATFASHGVRTFHAADGAQAIEISQRVMPDLLVLDLGLPEVDGFGVVTWLRRHERLHSVPLVVYTARDLDDADCARLRLGSTTQFLTKGRITSLDFEQRVTALLGQLTTKRTALAGPLARDLTVESGHEPEAHPVGR